MITSIHNEHVKSLLRLRKRRQRDLTGTFLIEGYREVERALPTVRLRTIYYCPSLWLPANEPALLAEAGASGAELVELAEAPFRRISCRDRPDGLLGVGVRPAAALAPDALTRLTLPPNPLVLVTEAIEKPGNLGMMIRTADAVGVSAALFCDPVTDPFNPSVIRASIGSLFAVPFAVTGAASARAWLRDRGIRALAATPSAGRSHWEVDLTGPVAVVVGSERRGLSDGWLGAGMERVRIPMAGVNDSLNVAMAAGTILFEAVRQRSRPSPSAAGPTSPPLGSPA